MHKLQHSARQLCTSAQRRFISKNAKKLKSQAIDYKKPEDFKLMKPKVAVTPEEINKRTAAQIQSIRSKHTGESSTTDKGYQQGLSSYYEIYEKAIPDAHALHIPKHNTNRSGWHFSQIPSMPEKPMHTFERHLEEWRSGALVDKYKVLWADAVARLPPFRRKPDDPFAGKQHLVNRITWKNPNRLMDFLTPSGKIMSTRYTGVRRKTQNKLKKEINKARFLGLVSYTGNPKFTTKQAVNMQNPAGIDEDFYDNDPHSSFSDFVESLNDPAPWHIADPPKRPTRNKSVRALNKEFNAQESDIREKISQIVEARLRFNTPDLIRQRFIRAFGGSEDVSPSDVDHDPIELYTANYLQQFATEAEIHSQGDAEQAEEEPEFGQEQFDADAAERADDVHEGFDATDGEPSYDLSRARRSSEDIAEREVPEESAREPALSEQDAALEELIAMVSNKTK